MNPAKAALRVLEDRGGFDHWWDGLPASIKTEIMREIDKSIALELTPHPLTVPESETIARALRNATMEQVISDSGWRDVKRTWTDTTLKLFLSEIRRQGFEIIKVK